MDLRLIRDRKRPDGVFSTLFTDTYDQLCVSVTHAYKDAATGMWEPKTPPGKYRCVRGMHALHDGVQFETFEIMDVPGHTDILFHVGNWNENSEGCECVGLKMIEGNHKGKPLVAMVTNSGVAFQRFMAAQEGCDEFELTVEED